MQNGYTIAMLQERIGYKFKDYKLLLEAITHSSFTNEQKINKRNHYERLEFLGDAVLELISSDFLYEKYSEYTEGELSKKRASLVCEPSLAICARKMELGEFIYFGKGEENAGGRERESILADVTEAIIGAMYLDGGIVKARKFVKTFVLNDLGEKELFFDSKTILQEYIQHLPNAASLHYETISETGPEHDKLFEVEARLDNQVLGFGEGKTKKAAQQQAAFQAIQKMKKE